MANADPDKVELRGWTPRAVIDVVDAIAIATRKDRIDVVNEVLLRWAREKVHEASVITRVSKGNPRLTESGWTPLE